MTKKSTKSPTGGLRVNLRCEYTHRHVPNPTQHDALRVLQVFTILRVLTIQLLTIVTSNSILYFSQNRSLNIKYLIQPIKYRFIVSISNNII